MQKPPQLLLRFFRWFCHPKVLKYIEGDLMELYDERVKEFGKQKADIKFIIDVLLLFRPGIIRPAEGYQNINRYAMYKSYFKIGWRNLTKNKGYAFINIGGLGVGMTVAMLIGLWVYDELSFNKHHQNYDRIAQVLVSGENSSGRFVQWNTSPPFGNEIRNFYGREFEHVLMSSRPGQYILSQGENKLIKTGYYVEPGIAEMLTLKMIKGLGKSLKNKESILLSESVAKTLFGDDDPLNKLLKIDNKLDVVVTGVYEDIPSNSDFSDMLFIATWDLYVSSNDWIRKHDWRQNGFYTFVQIAEHANMLATSNKIKDVKLNRIDKEEAAFKPQLFLHPMNRWRLYSDLENGSGRIEFVWLYGSIGLFVLLLACINFMNLATARSEGRAKEVGIRKSIGSRRNQLVNQFFCESLLVAALAFIMSICLTQLSLPFFNEVADKKTSIPWSNFSFWLLSLGFTAVTGILAGSYPALYLSSFQPVKVLKGTFKVGRFASVPRKVLVVLQFTVSITLIIGVIIVFQQIEFGKDRPVGYSREGLIWVNTYNREIHSHIDVVREELKTSGMVTEIAESVNTVTNVGFRIGGYEWPGMTPGQQAAFATAWIGHEFGRTVGWKFLEGRDFSRDYASDTAAMVLNETAVKFMNLIDPIGKVVKLTLFDKTNSFKVIGVIEDMLMESPYEPVRKTVYMIDNSAWGGSLVNVRIAPRVSTQEALSKIETVFKKYDPSSPFVYTFVDEAYARKFSEEERAGKLAFTFAGLAIFISCLGIFGLASFVAEQRTKEIGIRKILGASISSVWKMLSKEFVMLVIISCLIATPLSYYFMSDWLQQYEYRTTLSWYVFVLAGLSALILTLLTVSYQAVKAAIANPVESLRVE